MAVCINAAGRVKQIIPSNWLDPNLIARLLNQNNDFRPFFKYTLASLLLGSKQVGFLSNIWPVLCKVCYFTSRFLHSISTDSAV